MPTHLDPPKPTSQASQESLWTSLALTKQVDSAGAKVLWIQSAVWIVWMFDPRDLDSKSVSMTMPGFTSTDVDDFS